MNPNGHSQRIFILVFLGMLFFVPIFQAGLEIRRGERPRVLELFDRKPTSANLRAYEHGLEDASVVARSLRPWAQYAQFGLFKDGGEKALIGRDGWLFYKPGVLASTERVDAGKPTGTAEEAITAIVGLRDDLAASGIQLLVMPAPNKESVYPEKLPVGSPRSRVLRSAAFKTVVDGLRAKDVTVLDLLEVFERAKASQPESVPLYLAQDSHWSPSGVALAAQATARLLIEKQWVTPGVTEYDIKPIHVERSGDVLRMLQVPALEKRIAPEGIACSQVFRCSDRQPYRDEASSEVLVLGDSFLRIYETDEPGSAGFIAQLARELRRPMASLVNDGGASTLVRQELARRPSLLQGKKVVIYEFVERDNRLGTEGWQKLKLDFAKRSNL